MLDDKLMQVLAMLDDEWKKYDEDKEQYKEWAKKDEERAKNINGWYDEKEVKMFKKDAKIEKKEAEKYQQRSMGVVFTLQKVLNKLGINFTDIWDYKREHKEDK